MSKKTRKKSPKTSSAGRTPARSPKRAKAKAVKTTARASAGPAKSARGKASHRAASKALRVAAAASRKSPAKTQTKPAPVGLAEGTKAPAFRLPRDGGGTASLSDYAGKKLVLFFYPRANTPGCTREAIDFTRLKGAFAEAGTEVLGISADSLKAQESFRDKHKLAVPLISDEKHEMLEAYGAWGEKSLYGRTFLGIIRTTVLIGADGRIIRVWRNVRVDGHADQVLEAARAA
ncbi:redoxin domain-containing protein [Bradyrhizobium sp. NP1]|uniref:redoxin domain-containing protein n=1 Tax=Bradyrhizobium sp. NP1 TaxID=3049772 RepID=UPI0025A503EC|nr:redoxin domain-containing protein [Bradyrhizobium sp. NP1]WJR75141.1 redoxin domain-containing protein [Bradyrhizobium sp. NP1]